MPGPEADTLHVLPTAWFRNTWSWDYDAPKPELSANGPASVSIRHPFLGDLELIGRAATSGAAPELLFCENETNDRRLYGITAGPDYPKDGINDHVISGAHTVNPEQRGTKCAFWYQVTVQPGATVDLHLRLRPKGAKPRGDPGPGERFRQGHDQTPGRGGRVLHRIDAEAGLRGRGHGDAPGLLRACYGASSSITTTSSGGWTETLPSRRLHPGGSTGGTPAGGTSTLSTSCRCRTSGSTPGSRPGTWLSTRVALAHVDPAFAKYQLVLLCREWFQHPNGALPAYEWDFGDINPPVQAWAALEVFAISGGQDLDFLSRIFDKLLVNFTWWVNLEDKGGCNLFEGGFLGLDNIGPIDRSHLPVGGTLEQSDATGWMATYALSMAAIAIVLNRMGARPAQDLVLKFIEHFAAIRDAMETQGLWDDVDGLFYDRLVTPDGTPVPVKVHSMVGIIPMLACAVVDEQSLQQGILVGKQLPRLLRDHGLDDLDKLAGSGLVHGEPGNRRLLLGVVSIERLERIFSRLFDEREFLAPYGFRAISAYHLDHPYELDVEGFRASIDYEPAESTTSMFGGNSNWRGPLWFPVNYLVVEALGRYDRFFGDSFKVEYPVHSGQKLSLGEIAQDLRRRLVSIFLVGPDGRRPSFGGTEKLQTDPAWKDNIFFNEYFHGDNGAGLGATHQTGWTGVVADMIRRRHGDVGSLGDILRMVAGRKAEE